MTYKEAAELGIDDLEHGFFVNTQLDAGKKPDVCSESAGDETLARMDPGTPEAKDLIDTLVSHHVAITSTLPVFEGDLGGGRPPLRQQALDAMSPQAREDFFLLRQPRPASAPAPKIDPAMLWKHDLELERAFVAAGGLLLAGPDPTGRGDVLPGFGDQREIELLVEAGFSPVEAIKIATLNGAVYLGRDKQIGSIAAGKECGPGGDQGRSVETDFRYRECRNCFQGWCRLRLPETAGFGAGKVWAVLIGLDTEGAPFVAPFEASRREWCFSRLPGLARLDSRGRLSPRGSRYESPSCFRLRAAAILLECIDDSSQWFCWPGSAGH